MQYLFVKEAGKKQLILTGDEHRYIFKVRRHRKGETIALRNLEDNQLYKYIISFIDKKELHLDLDTFEVLSIVAEKKIHIAWCMIDPKSIERVLPILNELGVDKITLIYCKRSQKNFKIDLERWSKILLNSSQQCGRSQLLELNQSDSLENFLIEYPNTYMLNFSKSSLKKSLKIETIVVGCEGGFSEDELKLFTSEKIIGLNTPLILKSESAVCSVSTLLLL